MEMRFRLLLMHMEMVFEQRLQVPVQHLRMHLDLQVIIQKTQRLVNVQSLRQKEQMQKSRSILLQVLSLVRPLQLSRMEIRLQSQIVMDFL